MKALSQYICTSSTLESYLAERGIAYNRWIDEITSEPFYEWLYDAGRTFEVVEFSSWDDLKAYSIKAIPTFFDEVEDDRIVLFSDDEKASFHRLGGWCFQFPKSELSNKGLMEEVLGSTLPIEGAENYYLTDESFDHFFIITENRNVHLESKRSAPSPSSDEQ